MKSISYLYIGFILLVSGSLFSQSDDDGTKLFPGTWQSSYLDDNGEKVTISVIISGDYFAEAAYKKGEFLWTQGGSWKAENGEFTEIREFHSNDPEVIGKTVSYPYHFEDGILRFEGVDLDWKKIDDGTPGKLNGAWLFSGRMRNGEMTRRDTDQPRKTMKILSGTRFQWIAYNTETKEFMGTGGGTYTTGEGQYTETIEFFSRDNDRVGAVLPFEFELKGDEWHHRGKSSKGEPMYELWSRRKK